MVAVKPAQADAYLKKPPETVSAFLFYGSDPGLVSERAQSLARLLAQRDDPPGDVLRFSDFDFEQDSDRLGVELKTRPMFGGRNVVRVSASRRVSASMLKGIVDDGQLEGILIVEAGGLKPEDAMRKLFEKTSTAAAIGCYLDGQADISHLIGDVLEPMGLKIEPNARNALTARLGADRALSRAEIEKLGLYCLGKDMITEADVDAIVGDAADLTMERIAESAALGNARSAVADFGRAIASGEDAQAVILITQRYFLKLHRVRSDVDGGSRVDEALRKLRPPLHFKQRDTFSGLVRAWPRPALAEALERIGETAKNARLSAPLAQTHCERMMLGLAALAQRTQKRAKTASYSRGS